MDVGTSFVSSSSHKCELISCGKPWKSLAFNLAIAQLPATGGKIFVKAGVYPLTSTIQITQSNVQIQGEGMGITIFEAAGTMTGDTPALEVYNFAAGTARPLVADTAVGNTSLKIAPFQYRVIRSR